MIYISRSGRGYQNIDLSYLLCDIYLIIGFRIGEKAYETSSI